MACSTTPSRPASAPEHFLQRWHDIKSMIIHLLGVGLHIDANLLGHFDAVGLLDQPGTNDQVRKCFILIKNDQPWHKNSLHLALLPGLKVALLWGNVLNKLARLVSANLSIRHCWSWSIHRSFSYMQRWEYTCTKERRNWTYIFSEQRSPSHCSRRHNWMERRSLWAPSCKIKTQLMIQISNIRNVISFMMVSVFMSWPKNIWEVFRTP